MTLCPGKHGKHGIAALYSLCHLFIPSPVVFTWTGVIMLNGVSIHTILNVASIKKYDTHFQNHTAFNYMFDVCHVMRAYQYISAC